MNKYRAFTSFVFCFLISFLSCGQDEGFIDEKGDQQASFDDGFLHDLNVPIEPIEGVFYQFQFEDQLQEGEYNYAFKYNFETKSWEEAVLRTEEITILPARERNWPALDQSTDDLIPFVFYQDDVIDTAYYTEYQMDGQNESAFESGTSLNDELKKSDGYLDGAINKAIYVPEVFYEEQRLEESERARLIDLYALDLANSNDVKVYQNNYKVGVVIEKSRLWPLPGGYFELDTRTTMEDRFSLCDGQLFGEQSSVGIGTSFLLTDSVLCSAFHVFELPVSNYFVVFGFDLLPLTGKARRIFSSDLVFEIDQVLPNSDVNEDVIFFSLKEPTNRTPMAMGKSTNLGENNYLYMIGYPSGIPSKLSSRGRPTQNRGRRSFQAEIDAFAGNSGSPVFDAASHELVGMLVSGEYDWEIEGDCYVAKVCEADACLGERIIRIEHLLRLLYN